MRIKNPTLAHFRHFIPQGFSSLFTNLPTYKALYLRAYKALHLSRTLYKSALFMQNKPNFQDAQMNLKFCYKMNYKNLSRWRGTKTKPIQTQSPKGPNERKVNFNKGLQKKR